MLRASFEQHLAESPGRGSGIDDHPALKRDPRTDPRPEPAPALPPTGGIPTLPMTGGIPAVRAHTGALPMVPVPAVTGCLPIVPAPSASPEGGD